MTEQEFAIRAEALKSRLYRTARLYLGSEAYALDAEYGIMTRVGLHCAPAAHQTLGTYPTGTIRFSFGYVLLFLAIPNPQIDMRAVDVAASREAVHRIVVNRAAVMVATNRARIDANVLASRL